VMSAQASFAAPAKAPCSIMQVGTSPSALCNAQSVSLSESPPIGV
jgi:hypothetical protein